MTKKLEDLFNLSDPVRDRSAEEIIKENEIVEKTQENVDKINAALPLVKDLETNDKEMDDLATSAKESFEDLMSMGLEVETKYAGRILEVAASFLNHAITAKTAKADKKLRMIELQLKKARIDQYDHAPANNAFDEAEDGNATVWDRNVLFDELTEHIKKQNEDK